MCCLKYEQDQYEQTRKKMPKVGKEVITPEGPGVVWDLNIIKETVRVRIQKGDSSELKDFPMDEVQRPGAQNNRREEPAAPAAVEAPDEVQPDELTVEEAPAEPQPQPRRKERPAREDRKSRRAEGEKAPREERRPKQEENAEKPVEKPAEKPAEPAKPEEPAKPAANGWKAALERAMKEAENTGKA